MADFNGSESQIAILRSPSDYHDARSSLVLFGLNVIFAISAILGNVLILFSLYKESSLHTPSKCLLRSLAFSDLCVGIIAQPAFAVYLLPFSSENEQTALLVNLLTTLFNAVLCAVSLFTVTAISVDRLFALTLGLRYRHVVTLNRVKVVVIFTWLVALGFSMLYFWSEVILLVTSSLVVLLCIATSTYCYVTIYFRLRRHKRQIRNHIDLERPNEATAAVNIARYSKTVSTALWVYITLLVCYLPFAITAALTSDRGNEAAFWVAFDYTNTIVFLSSSLNPVLYCWKMREVRTSAKTVVKQLCCL